MKIDDMLAMSKPPEPVAAIVPVMVTRAEVNVRGPKDVAHLVLDGEPFLYSIDKKHGVKVEVNDNNVHLVVVAIQVDHAVTITDHTSPAEHE